MKITYAPIVVRASGKFGGSVFSNWKGIDLIRRFAKPSNPNTALQQEVRMLFRNITRIFIQLPFGLRSSWTSWATGKPVISRNGFLGSNIPVLKGEADVANFVFSQGDASSIPPSTVAAVSGGLSGEIDITWTDPSTPAGWSLTQLWMCALKTFDPTPPTLIDYADLIITEDTAIVTVESGTLSGLTPAASYGVGVFAEWLDPQGNTRYSISTNTAAVVVALA